MSPSVNRRDFVSTAALAGAAAGVAVSTHQVVAQDQSRRPVVVGVMGMSRGRSLATGFAKLPNVEVAYCCDIDQDRAASAAAQVSQLGTISKPKAIEDFRNMLDDPRVDALVCAAPNHWHAPATIMACNAGKHVYVEKPCSHNPQEGEWMVEAARKHNRCVQMGSQRRSGAQTQQAIKKLHDGAIGKLYLSKAWYNNARGSIGTGKPAAVPANQNYELWQGPAPRRDYVDNLVHYNWHWRWHWGNGELGNNGIHTLDLCRWGMDVEFPTRVTSSGGRYCYEDDQETPDTHSVAFEFNGDKQITWEGLSCHRHGGGFVAFYGTEGALILDSNGTHQIYDARDKLVEEVKGVSRGDTEHLANFVQAIRTKDHSILNAEIEKGHRSTMLCHLGNISHRTGRALNCNPTNGHILNDADAAKLWRRDYEKGWEPKV
ncbi:MAG TPA: dehydrogenase [Planctomycetaceae bacterium]|nr:dehydrogenase [Planctomycetaceae bacterium]